MSFEDHDRYDVCVWCFAPGCMTDTAVHAVTCPMVTNCYPVTEQEADECACTGCKEVFQLGDFYSLVPFEEEIEERFWMLCLGCAVSNRKPHTLEGTDS